MLYLCETIDTSDKLHPAPGHATRARFLLCVMFAIAEGYETVMFCSRRYRAVRDMKMNESGERRMENLVAAKLRFEKVVLSHLLKELSGDEMKHHLGDEFS